MGAVEVEGGLGGAIDPSHAAGSAWSFSKNLEEQFKEGFRDDARRAIAHHGRSARFSGFIGRF